MYFYLMKMNRKSSDWLRLDWLRSDWLHLDDFFK